MDRDRIIVLRKIPYRDSDLIIRGLNTQGAKVSYLATAALKSRRRFGGGVLEPTNFIEVLFQKSSSASTALVRIQEAQVIREFPGLRRTYELIQMGLSLLSLVDQVGQEGDAHGEELFNLLGHSLQYLAQQEVVSLAAFRLHFLIKFLFQQGVLDLEPWMPIFLKTPIRDHSQLPIDLLTKNELLDYLVEMERRVQGYRETGSVATSLAPSF